MLNLAGDPDCDTKIRRELTRARISIVEGARSRSEVAASVTGKLGQFTFRRAWYYWVADGPVPIDIARKLWNDPVGKQDVRSGGHCACPSPDKYGARYYDADGVQLYDDPDGSEQRKVVHLIEQGILKPGDIVGRFVPDKRAAAVRAVVDCYHIDSEVGLRLFADAVRGLASDRQESERAP